MDAVSADADTGLERFAGSRTWPSVPDGPHLTFV